MDYSREVAQKLLQIKAIKLNPQNPFTWASGLRSPIYCDNRLSLSYPDARNTIKRALALKVAEFGHIEMIAGVATAGIAHGALMADELNLPFAYVRSEAKSHGRQNQIEGDIRKDQNILVVEDLISTGGSSLQVVEVLRNEGYKVAGVLAIFDYQFSKAANNFKSNNCTYRSVCNYSELIKEAVSSQYISANDLEILKDWNKDPQYWSDQHQPK
jgi:orotate phosphoribosyltransferase